MGTITTLRPCTPWCTRQHPKDEIAEEGGTWCETERHVTDRITVDLAQAPGEQPSISVWSGHPGGFVENITEEEAVELAMTLAKIVGVLRRARGEW